MDVAALTAMLIWAAQAIGLPTPPMPVIYPTVPEGQICALVTNTPCDPYIHARERPIVWLGVASRFGKWVGVQEGLKVGSMYWKMVLVHEFTHVAQSAAHKLQGRLCRRVNEHQATLVTAAWLRTQGTSYEAVTGWVLQPFEAASSKEIRVCGYPHLHIEREKRDEQREDNPGG